MSPVFSIIIPVYNVAPYLRECLDSVLAQTLDDWEAICIDDGSTDDSGSILDEYALRDSRFRVIHQPNAGVSVARNKALDETKGEWLAFLDSDDLLERDFFEKLLNAANVAKADLAIGGVIRFGDNRDGFYVGPQTDGSYAPEDLYVKYNSLCAWSWGKIYKQSLWSKIRFPMGMAYSEDRYVLHEILYAYPKLPFVAGALYRYRARNDSAYGSSWKPEMVQRRFAFEQQMAFFHKEGYLKAELFTAGLYFIRISHDICRLAEINPLPQDLLEKIREGLCRADTEYWKRFVKMAKQESWSAFPSCGAIRTCMDKAYYSRSMPFVRRLWNVLKYDGLIFVCRKMISRLRM